MVPICEIGNDAKNNGFVVQGSGTNSQFTSSTCTVGPYEMGAAITTTMLSTDGSVGAQTEAAANWISPHVPLMALAFDRYRATSLAFHYEPQATATAADRLVFAWTDDPAHPFLGVNQTSPVTQLNCLVTKDSVAFMPWKPWSLRVPVAPDMRFMYNDATVGSETGTSRFFEMGAMSCVGSAAPSATIYGVLYAEMVLEFYDPVPIIQSIKSLITEVHALKKAHRSRPVRVTRLPPDGRETKVPPVEKGPAAPDVRETYFVESGDVTIIDSPAPPTYKPPPSSAPGTPAYKVPSRK